MDLGPQSKILAGAQKMSGSRIAAAAFRYKNAKGQSCLSERASCVLENSCGSPIYLCKSFHVSMFFFLVGRADPNPET